MEKVLTKNGGKPVKKPCELLLVMLFDFHDRTYTVIDHNLDRKVALEKTADLCKQNLPAFTLTQEFKHRSPEAQRCSSCKKQVEKAFAGWSNKPQKG